jgi:hypothetical protein
VVTQPYPDIRGERAIHEFACFFNESLTGVGGGDKERHKDREQDETTDPVQDTPQEAYCIF